MGSRTNRAHHSTVLDRTVHGQRGSMHAQFSSGEVDTKLLRAVALVVSLTTEPQQPEALLA